MASERSDRTIPVIARPARSRLTKVGHGSERLTPSITDVHDPTAQIRDPPEGHFHSGHSIWLTADVTA